MPVAFIANLALPAYESLPVGVPDALGCSGGPGYIAPSEPRWLSVKPAQNDEKSVPVATDGFFAIDGSYVGLTDEQVLASLEVVVSDDGGSVVEGEVRWIEHTLTWAAKEPLEIGQRLTASLKGTSLSAPPVGGDYTLEVVGEPDALPAATWIGSTWTQVYRGVGQGAMCPDFIPAYGGCGGTAPPQFVSTAYEADGGVVDLASTTEPKAGVL